MGLGQIHKLEFKMRSTCINQKKEQLIQIEAKILLAQP
jgi:hypothetical protein